MMLKELTMWPQKLQEGFALVDNFYKEYSGRVPTKIKKIVFVGMGGSGIAGRIIKTFLDRKEGISSFIIDSSEVSGAVDTETLAIVISYSGNTWETLDVLSRLVTKFVPTIVLAHGGNAIEISENKNIPFVILPQSLSPRSALGIFLGFLLGLFEKLGILEGKRKFDVFYKFSELYVPKFSEQHFFKDFLYAVNGYEMFHVWGVSGSSAACAYRAATQFCENSKIQAVFSSFPEANHNLINGFAFFKQNPCVVLFYTDFLPVNMGKAIEATCEILKEKGVVLYKPPIFGHTFEEQLINIVLWSDFASYYLGKVRGVDVDNVPMIENLKNRQRLKGIKLG